MSYIKNGRDYPRFIGDILLENPNWIEGDDLPTGWELVTQAKMPVVNKYERLIEDFPILENGQWSQVVRVEQFSQAEIDGEIALQELFSQVGKGKTLAEVQLEISLKASVK